MRLEHRDEQGYGQLVSDALATPFEGWDWSALRGRFVHEQPSWDYREIVRGHARQAAAMLDLGTGGGEPGIPDFDPERLWVAISSATTA